jgi:hypothetical protein
MSPLSNSSVPLLLLVAAAISAALPSVADERADGPSLLSIERPGGRRPAPQSPPPTGPAEAVTVPQSAIQSAAEVDEDLRKTERSDYLNYEVIPVPDRWRIVDSLGVVNPRWWDPYHQNTLKADRPIFGTQDWFFDLALISDTLVEPRRIPTPVGTQANARPNTLDIFAPGDQLAVVQNLISSVTVVKGDTVFHPPEFQFRYTGVGNINYTRVDALGVVNVRPEYGTTRTDGHFGIQELFAEALLNVHSDRFDFTSVRLGVQPFSSDFRGFLFKDEALGARLFGTFGGNRLEYNLAYFRRIEKDTNSGLNDVSKLRHDDVVIANIYYQDVPLLGFTTQATFAYNRNREGSQRRLFNANGFLVRPAPIGDQRPHNYDVFYSGLNGDGHIERMNLTYSFYFAAGEDQYNPIAQRKQDIRAFFAAVEASYDQNWVRWKLFGLYASGDADPQDSKATGFDAIFENPNFAGADTAFWQRQAIPVIFASGVALSGRNALLPALRSSKTQGQSNFVNPGLGLVGVGADFEVLPGLRVSPNISWLTFAHTEPLEFLRNQPVRKEIGYDLSAAIVYRPLFIENIVFRAAGAVLLPGRGARDLFKTEGDLSPFYSVLANVILTY